jgi:hypothetical protein
MATFLQRILLSSVDYTNGLKLYHVLGADSVDASKAVSDFTPVQQQNWRYSYGQLHPVGAVRPGHPPRLLRGPGAAVVAKPPSP